jgi:putative phosphoesterase
MRIGIVADSHDDISALRIALSGLQSEGVGHLIHCGDLCGPSVVPEMSAFNTWVARGNMDRHPALESVAASYLGPGRLAVVHRLTLGGHAIAVVHGDDLHLLSQLVSSARFAYVLHGHTHVRRDECFSGTRVVNPGAVGSRRTGRQSYCILDLTYGEISFREITVAS